MKLNYDCFRDVLLCAEKQPYGKRLLSTEIAVTLTDPPAGGQVTRKTRLSTPALN